MRTPNVRQSRPDYSNGLYGGRSAGGLGPIARRGWDDYTSRLIAMGEQQGAPGLRHFYETAPLRLLKVLLSIHPMAKMAHSNNAAAACSPGDTEIVAEETITDPQSGKEATVPHAEDTKLIAAFLARYPGGLPGLQRALLKQLEWSGGFCLEAVPGKRGKGVGRYLTFDPLSIYYRDLADGTRVVQQYGSGFGTVSGAAGGFALPGVDDILDVDLDGTGEGTGTILIGALDYEDDNPYGDPLMGGFLAEGIKDLGQERNLSDILRGWAYPHLSIGFPVDEVMARAKAHPELLERTNGDGEPYQITPEEYAQEEFDAFMVMLNGINPDDPLVTPKGAEASVLDGASGVAALDPLLKMRRHRAVMGLDQMPSMLGITDGGTQAYAAEQARQQAKKLEYLRGLVNAAVVWLCNLHLRLLGRNRLCRAVTQQILPQDRLADANARKVEVDTDLELADEGYLTSEEIAQRHGTGTVGPAKPGGRKQRQRRRGSAKNAGDSAAADTGDTAGTGKDSKNSRQDSSTQDAADTKEKQP